MSADKITKQQYDELQDAYDFDEQQFVEKLEEYTGITRHSYTAYSYYSESGNYIGDSNDFDLDDCGGRAMNEHDIAEQAYKNGYEKGKQDAVKHGRWNKGINFPIRYVCSECGHQKEFKRPYCEICGAKMD